MSKILGIGYIIIVLALVAIVGATQLVQGGVPTWLQVLTGSSITPIPTWIIARKTGENDGR